MCAHHVTSDTLLPCDQVPTVAPTCGKTCPSNTSINYATDKVKGASSYAVGPDVESIKQEIFANGSVTAAFTVYEDFLTYTSGVYQHITGAAEGGHAIKCIGWGVENDLPYWLCVNSWNNTWGDKGLFKILQGDCGINDQMHAGMAM